MLRAILILLAMISFFTTILLLVCRDASHFNGLDPVKDRLFVNAFIDRLYFLLSVITTTGFGDLTPATRTAKLCVIFIYVVLIVTIMKSLDVFVSVYDSKVAGSLASVKKLLVKATGLGPAAGVAQTSATSGAQPREPQEQPKPRAGYDVDPEH